MFWRAAAYGGGYRGLCAGCCLCFGALLPWPRIRRSCGLFAVDFVLESCFIGRGYSDLAVCLRAVVQVYVLESCCIGGGYRRLFCGPLFVLWRAAVSAADYRGCVSGLSFVFWRAAASAVDTGVLWFDAVVCVLESSFIVGKYSGHGLVVCLRADAHLLPPPSPPPLSVAGR